MNIISISRNGLTDTPLLSPFDRVDGARHLTKIVAIGGGSLKVPSIDKEIIRLSGKKRPKVLLIPTASRDSLKYVKQFKRIYGARHGCKVEVLRLCADPPSLSEIRKMAMSSDVIYVGGGNTLMMVNLWKRLGVDRVLREAWLKGKVMCGVSAGAICWFGFGSSDARKFYDPKDSTLIKVSGLGFVPCGVSPHHIQEKHRDKGLKLIMRRSSGVAVGLDDWAAIEVIGNGYRIIASRKGSSAKIFRAKGGKVSIERIPKTEEFMPLSALLDGNVPRKRALVYGFKPFLGQGKNVTEQVIKRLHLPDDCVKMVFPVRFSRRQFAEALDRWRPRYVLGMGQCPAGGGIRVEKLAMNSRSAARAGAMSRPIEPGGPRSIPVNWELEQPRGGRLSFDAGQYVCNYSMYSFLRECARYGTRYAFMHIPADHPPGKVAMYVRKVC